MTDLAQGCVELGLDLADEQIARLHDYEQLLVKWNKAINLISRQDIDRVVPRHLLDSLAAFSLLGEGPVLDVGSGGGLPGIPLAIALDSVSFTLCERMTKRARFLQLAVRELGLSNVRVEAVDVELLPADVRFPTIVARAVASPRNLWKLMADRLDSHGSLLVFSSTRVTAEDGGEEVELEEIEGVETLVHRVRVPGMENAHTLCELKRT